MDVWLPYSDVEIPIMLPDPIDLRLVSRRFSSIERERSVIKKLNDLLSGMDSLRICDSPLLLPSERVIIGDKMKILGLDYEFSRSDFNVVINLVRNDPVFGITCSYMHEMACLDGLGDPEAIKEACKNRGRSENVLYLDLLVDGLGRLQEVFTSDLEFASVVEAYEKYWGGVSETTSFMIGSLGGYPWDRDLHSIVVGFSKALDLVRDNIVILVGDGELSDEDIDYLLGIKRDVFLTLYLDLIRRRLEHISGRIYYYGSLPKKVCREFGFRYIKDINKFIKTVPIKVMRESTIIEDILHVNISIG